MRGRWIRLLSVIDSRADVMSDVRHVRQLISVYVRRTKIAIYRYGGF